MKKSLFLFIFLISFLSLADINSESSDEMSPQELFEQGVLYYEGKEVTQDLKRAFDYFKTAANEGHLDSQAELGAMYLYGEGVDQSTDEAFFWLEKASKGGDPLAQFNLGVSYYYGIKDGDQNLELAFHFFEKSALQGYPAAQVELATMYYSGIFVEEDFEKAFYFYDLAAKKEDPYAQFNLATMYARGHGVSSDFEKALEYFEKAAEGGQPNAQYNLGRIYFDGVGVKRDIELGIKWLKRSANQNFSDAQYRLGEIYYTGDGVRKDFEEARKWLEQAALLEHPEAKSILAKMDKSLFERTAQIKFPDKKGQTSGFFITHNGLITNYHVVSSVVSSENKEISFVVFKDGVEKKGTGEVVAVAPHADLALIKTTRSDYPYFELGVDEDIKVGEEIFILGSGQDSLKTLSYGTILKTDEMDFQITGLAIDGFSGSPVLNNEGQVIGVLKTKSYKNHLVSKATNVSYVRSFFE